MKLESLLYLSTVHVPGPDPDFADCRVQGHAYGWIVFIDPALEADEIPEWLWPVWEEAVRCSCILINFDGAAPTYEPHDLVALAGMTVPKLEIYNW